MGNGVEMFSTPQSILLLLFALPQGTFCARFSLAYIADWSNSFIGFSSGGAAPIIATETARQQQLLENNNNIE